MSNEFINVKSSALEALFTKSITDYDRKVYLTLCRNATFKHQVYGVYKRQTFWTLANEVALLTKEKKKISQLQRSIERLEAAGLVKVLFQSRDTKIDAESKELIISLDTTATLQSICSAIENNIEDFNIYADRIKEIENNLVIKLNIVKKSKSKEKIQILSTPAELEEDSKLAAEFFPSQLHSFPEAALISSAIASARDSPT
ncbi:hypothetical protein [Delftia acidovorans]|uniref:hypothetical protein n=1 Tax=Delftia acidovorans TaxID=80866 RepID=UPI0028ADA002|nr:hypothetical protein [Delftia acidovorans]